jgi:hypothetical protein
MEFLKKNSTSLLIALFVLLGILSLYQSDTKKTTDASLSALVEAINKGEVKKIEVYNNDLTVTKADDSVLTIQKEGEASLTETLKN